MVSESVIHYLQFRWNGTFTPDEAALIKKSEGLTVDSHCARLSARTTTAIYPLLKWILYIVQFDRAEVRTFVLIKRCCSVEILRSVCLKIYCLQRKLFD
jgi:hypothetical protein